MIEDRSECKLGEGKKISRVCGQEVAKNATIFFLDYFMYIVLRKRHIVIHLKMDAVRHNQKICEPAMIRLNVSIDFVFGVASISV